MSCWAEEVPEEADGREGFPMWCLDGGQPQDPPTFGAKLTEGECSQLQDLLSKFKSTLQGKPGRTNLAEHRIPVESSRAVRLPPYRLPHAYLDTVKEELQSMLKKGSLNPWIVSGHLPLC